MDDDDDGDYNGDNDDDDNAILSVYAVHHQYRQHVHIQDKL